jgi:hypothetical protein
MVLVPLVPRPLGRLRMLLPSLQAQAATPPPSLPPPPPSAPPPPESKAATEDEEDAALALRFGFHV